MGILLGKPEIEAFSESGFLLIRDYFDVEREISPILNGIRLIIEALSVKYGYEQTYNCATDAMVEGYTKLIRRNRTWGGEVYDAVKQIPEFISLVASPANSETFKKLRGGSIPGIAAGGYGIRIDNPGEERFRAPWHQEFPAQLRSVDGVVFWSPLISVTEEMGPVQIASGSHKEGPIPVFEEKLSTRTGAYSLKIENEKERLKKFEIVAPTTNPGDLVLMDFLTLHRSGQNFADRPRWSMQFRYFNFRDPVGIDISWSGSYAEGKKFEDIVPSLKSANQ